MRIVGVIREPPVIDRILKHLHYCFKVLLPAAQDLVFDRHSE